MESHVVRSFNGFIFGLFLASVYGVTVLFVQNQELWFCVYTTIAIAFIASFGMGLSVRVRSNVMLMMPMLCSDNGKNLLLFLIFSMVIQGPMTNTLENFGRAADSVVCGAELTMNQTQELMQRAATPLFPVLDKIKDITRNAYSVASRVQNFIQALTDSVQHVARTLRNVLHFLVGIGDVCNDKLGTPYKKCNKLFDDAREDCMNLLSIFNFLCHIVDGFRPLCGVSRVGQLFCIIPSYVASHLKERLEAPTAAALDRIKQEFEFNISASVHFDMSMNSSQSMQQVSQNILKEVSSGLGHFQEAVGLLAYVGLILMPLTYLWAVLYKHKYLQQDNFDNNYISKQFEELDLKMGRQGRPTVLPLNKREARIYIKTGAMYQTSRERRVAAIGTISVLRHLVLGFMVAALDLLVYWMFDLVHHQAQGDIVTRAPVLVAVQINGTGYASDILKDMVSSFDVLQKGNITVLSKKCIMQPSEPDYSKYILIGFLYGLTLFSVLAGSYVKRLRSLVCARYHPRRERERVRLLHGRILSQRVSLCKALLSSVARSKADGAGAGLLHTLMLRVPGGSFLAELLGVSSVSCMACGRGGEGRDDSHMVTCSTPQCKGLYCRQCFRSMNNICAVCMGPLTFQEDCEEELPSSWACCCRDSSDDEHVSLWTAALASPHITERRARKLMKRTISMEIRRRSWAEMPRLSPVPGGSRVLYQRTGSAVTPGHEGDSDGSGHVSPFSDPDVSEPDMSYQDRSDSEDSDPRHYDPRRKYVHNSIPDTFSDIYFTGGVSRQASESDSSDSDTLFQSLSSDASNHSREEPLQTVTVHSLTMTATVPCVRNTTRATAPAGPTPTVDPDH
ncbi:DC-STAMP domain-containing protein 2 [Osmerus mordax]|uniref:DC-STAMP domain-containing protein 2 n=1 Tax=Osmerus mordax TaxID=8014 RepID=UPI00350FE6B7